MCDYSADDVIIYKVQGALAISILPFVFWCAYKHTQRHRKTKSVRLVYSLSVAQYICTLIASVAAGIWTFAGCQIPMSLSWLLYYVQTAFWLFQWMFFILLLFCRVKTVFHESVYKLSNCSVVAFIILYTAFTAFSAIGFITYFTDLWTLYLIGNICSLLTGLAMATYLPILFIYKLFQFNNESLGHAFSSESPSPRSQTTAKTDVFRVDSTRSQSGSRTKSTAKDQDTILVVIRKCAVLTVFSMISTWTVFVCIVVGVRHGFSTHLLHTWNFAIILDSNTNFLGVALSNDFCDVYYRRLCGCVDACFWTLCCCAFGRSDLETQTADFIEAAGAVTPATPPYACQEQPELSLSMETVTCDCPPRGASPPLTLGKSSDGVSSTEHEMETPAHNHDHDVTTLCFDSSDSVQL